MATVATGQVLAIGGAVILLLGALWIIRATIKEWVTAYRLHNAGRRTQAKIIDLRMEIVGRAARPIVIFSFPLSSAKPGAQRIHGQQQVSAHHFSQLTKNQTVMIRYWPANPRLARLVGENTIHNRLTAIALIAILLFPPLILAALVFLLLESLNWRG